MTRHITDLQIMKTLAVLERDVQRWVRAESEYAHVHRAISEQVARVISLRWQIPKKFSLSLVKKSPNRMTVSLGADYFAEMSAEGARDFVQRRLKCTREMHAYTW